MECNHILTISQLTSGSPHADFDNSDNKGVFTVIDKFARDSAFLEKGICRNHVLQRTRYFTNCGFKISIIGQPSNAISDSFCLSSIRFEPYVTYLGKASLILSSYHALPS